MDRRVRGTVLAATAILAAGCTTPDGAQPHPRPSSASTLASVPASPSSTVDDELSLLDAQNEDIRAADVVSVSGPSEVRADDDAVDVRIRIELPTRRSSSRLQVVWSGDCVFPDRHKEKIVDASRAGSTLFVTVSARLPKAVQECYFQADALFANRPATGDGITVTLRR